jgi:hypothetical protein
MRVLRFNGSRQNHPGKKRFNWLIASFMVLLHVGAVAALFFFTWESLTSNSCTVMCGKPSQQTRKREIACVRNKLFSLARIASKESHRTTEVTSGDSDLPEAKARTPR